MIAISRSRIMRKSVTQFYQQGGSLVHYKLCLTNSYETAFPTKFGICSNHSDFLIVNQWGFIIEDLKDDRKSYF